MWGYPPPGPPDQTRKPSRRCHHCEINWPNVPGWNTCQICGAATQPQEAACDFPSTEEAWRHAHGRRESLRKHREFKDYCEGWDEYLVEEFMAELDDDAGLAAHFAKLKKLPTKEVKSDR